MDLHSSSDDEEDEVIVIDPQPLPQHCNDANIRASLRALRAELCVKEREIKKLKNKIHSLVVGAGFAVGNNKPG